LTNTSAIFVQGAFLRPHNVQLLEAVENRANVYLLGKRVIDIIFSLVICVFILSWLLPLLAILIKIDSKGPVFFRQKRSGFQGKTFDCFKLRTMRLNANSDDLQAAINDPRITRMGSFLRMSNLDELPQFINVLMGDNVYCGSPAAHA